MSNDFTFEFPYVLLLFFIFILSTFLFKYKPQTILFPHINLINKTQNKISKILPILKWLSIISTLIALASPVVINKYFENNNIGYDIVLSIDASGSMRHPFSSRGGVDKFTVTKAVVAEFIQKRENDNLGLVGFGEFAFIVSPLTFDKELLKTMLENVNMNESFSNGTAIGDAIAQSVKALEAGEAKEKVIILVTDGNEEGNVRVPFDKATKIAKKRGIKIYTIGIGRDGDFNGPLLNFISSETGGNFFSANSPDGLLEIYKQIDNLEKSKIKSKGFETKEYYYFYPLILAIISLLLYIFIKYKEEL